MSITLNQNTIDIKGISSHLIMETTSLLPQSQMPDTLNLQELGVDSYPDTNASKDYLFEEISTYVDSLKPRQLGHDTAEGKYEGTNIDLRAERDEDGNCIIYSESLFDHFKRMMKNFPEGDSNWDACTSWNEAEEYWGLHKQGQFGNQKKKKPSVFNIKATFKWSGWNKMKGKDPVWCQQEYITRGEDLLGRINKRDKALNKNAPAGPEYYEGCDMEKSVVIEEVAFVV